MTTDAWAGSLGSVRSFGAVGWISRPVVAFVAALAISVARLPETILRPEFFNEDGQVFYLGTYFGSPLERIFAPHSGYLHVVPRLLAYAERAVPIASAPLVSNVIALGIMAAGAAFVASDVLPGPRPLRLLVALLVVLEPVSSETIGSLTYAQWYLAIFLFAFAFTARPSRVWIVPLALAALTGPFSVIVAPVYAVRWYRDRAFLPFAATVIAGALLQGSLMVLTHRGVDSPPGNVAEAIVRIVDVPILGLNVSLALGDLALPVALVLAVAVAVIARSVPSRLRWSLVYAISLMAVIGLFARGDGSLIEHNLPNSTRYFFLPALALGTLVVAALCYQPRAVTWAVAAMLLVGIVGDFRLSPRPVMGWMPAAACIGGEQPCEVPVWFPGWSIRWPGVTGTYEPWPSG